MAGLARRSAAALAWALLAAHPLRAGLTVTASAADFVPKAADDPAVVVQALGADPGGTTSVRFESDKKVDPNKFLAASPDSVNRNRAVPYPAPKVQQRDRDLGQTFLTGPKGFKVDAVYLRLGFTDRAALPGVQGAKVAVQFLEVSGAPRLNDSGTPGRLGRFDRVKSPELDDYLEGETFRPVGVAVGTLPTGLKPGTFLKFDLTGDDEVELKPNGHYAFMVMIVERGPERAFSLANSFFGKYAPDPANPLVGHGLRREGGTGRPEAPFYKPDLPDDFEARLKQQPGTLGFPDVCTFRDLYFTITAAPAAAKDAPGR